MASLIGSANLHPKCASDFSRSIIARILRNAPRAATPGNKLPIRSFNTQTGKPEMLIITPEARPNHFVRPNMDDVFVMSGAFFVFMHVALHSKQDSHTNRRRIHLLPRQGPVPP